MQVEEVQDRDCGKMEKIEGKGKGGIEERDWIEGKKGI
jgi:hypothetical protein